MKNFRFACIWLALSLTVAVAVPWQAMSIGGRLTPLLDELINAQEPFQQPPKRQIINPEHQGKKVTADQYADSAEASLSTVAPSQGGSVVLQVDDGSFEQVIGYPDGVPTAYFLNRLTPPSYPATLQNVQIFFGNRANGLRVNHPITLLVGANSSGGSNIDGIAFQRFSSVVGFLNEFNQYNLPAVTINSGDFVVGYVTQNPLNIFPMEQDTTPPSQRRSYTSTDGSTFTIVDTFGSNLAGNFGIRATVNLGTGPSNCTPQTISCPGSASGSLSSGDCTQGRRGPNFFTDIYQFTGTAGQTVTIDLTSSAFDTFLFLISPSGTVAAQDDDGGDGTNSRITFTLTSSGSWRIEATSFSAGATGAYSLALAGCGGGRTTNNPPTLNRVDVTRITLSHGRLDDFREDQGRPIGIRSTANPSGRCVPGISPSSTECPSVAPACFPPPPPAIPPSILDVIAAQPNPSRITLDTDGDGRPNNDSVIAIAACAMPSCFTLAVAEGMADPDGDPIVVRWDFPGPRFGAGNYYATVSIPNPDPNKNIVAGMELTTFEQLAAYDANSIFWEAPDVGPIIVDEILDGGTEELPVRVIDIPPAPLMPLMSAPQFGGIEFARTIRAVIKEACKRQNPDGSFTIEMEADLPASSDDPLNKTWFRWAFEGNTITILGDIPATPLVRFEVPKEEAGVQARITVVASSFGPAVPGNPNPFVEPMPGLRRNPPGGIGLTTFNSRGCTVSDTASVLVERRDQEICGDGLDNDCDGQIDEDCNFRLFVDDNECRDDTIGVRVDGQDLGQTPAGRGRFFDISQFTSGEHTLVITAVASGGEPFGCSPDPIVTYGVSLIGGVQFVQKENAPFTGTADSGRLMVGTQIRYTINIP